MNIRQLEHAIRVACEITGDDEVYVFGSQAVLAQFPMLEHEVITASIEVDIQPKNRTENTDLLDGSIGEDSYFHRTHGYYVHGVPIETAVLPSGWQNRVVVLVDPVRTGSKTGLCVELYDIAASKLVAFREKDIEFVGVLLAENAIGVNTLKKRVEDLPAEESTKERILRWLSQYEVE